MTDETDQLQETGAARAEGEQVPEGDDEWAMPVDPLLVLPSSLAGAETSFGG